jgi:hypothetical protein
MTAQLALIDEPSLYHQPTGPAYFGILQLVQGSKKLHELYPVEHMAWTLDHLDLSRDSFITQGEFYRQSRTLASLRSIGLVFADLDDHDLFANGDAWAVGHILQAVEDEGLPAPSLIVHSGRGAHLKWLFDRPVPKEDLPRWDALEREIVARLRDQLDADGNCRDATRVLRIVGTVNMKSGNVVRIVWRNDLNGELVRYSFDTLFDEVVPLRPSHDLVQPDGQPVIKPTAARRPNTGYTIRSLHWGRFNDLRQLCRARGWTKANGGIPVGHRDQMIFLMAVSLSYLARPETWWQELTAIAYEFAPSLPRSEWGPAMSTVFRRLKESRVGHDLRYKYTTARIISDLAITRTEMMNFKVLIDDDIYRERERERSQRNRQAAGASKRITPRRAQILNLNFKGLNTPDIASALGVSRRTVERILTP